ncbi:unnamed protein product [Musa hybrid cultivar]
MQDRNCEIHRKLTFLEQVDYGHGQLYAPLETNDRLFFAPCFGGVFYITRHSTLPDSMNPSENPFPKE